MNNIWQKRFEKIIKKGGRLHFTLLDPQDYSPGVAAYKAGKAVRNGTDGIMIGGSTVNKRSLVFETVKAIRFEITGTGKPIILFPNCANSVSKGADCLFFMMLLNSKKIEFLIGEQLKGAPFVKKFGIEPIPMGYVVVSTGQKPTTVELVGGVDRVTEKDIDKIVNYALTAECLGMKFFYLEAGSGAEKSVSNKVISNVKKKTELYLVVGGGIKTPEIAKDKIKAGADIIVTTFNDRLADIILATDE